MVDAFPLPRHRQKSCCSRSQCSHSKKQGFVYPRARRSYSVTKNCIELVRAILADIQRGAEQLQTSMTMNNHHASHVNNLPHAENTWMKVPKMPVGKKTFEGWPVRDVFDGHGHVSRHFTPMSTDNAYTDDNQRFPRDLDEDKEADREADHGLAAAPQSEKTRVFLDGSTETDDRASRPSARLIPLDRILTSNLEDPDVVDIPQTQSTPDSSNSHYHHHGPPNNPPTFPMTLSPLPPSRGAPFSPAQERLYVHPIEWTVKETVSWLRSKGFDDSVCDKFVEQEITGDALLSLDATSLKTEIGIDAYGKRFRIANAIDDLRRVASGRFPPVRPTWSRSSSQTVRQKPGLKPLPLTRSSSVGDLMSPSTQPNSGYLPKTPILSPFRELDPDESTIVQKPSESGAIRAKTEAQDRISPSHSPGSGQGKIVPGRPLQPSSYRSDEALGVSIRRTAINRDWRKRGNAAQADTDSIQLVTQGRDPRDDRQSSSSSIVKMTLSPSMEIATLLPLKRRSRSMCEWQKGRLEAQYERSSTSTLVGTASLTNKSGHLSRGYSISSMPSLSTNPDTGNRKKDRKEKYESSCSGGSKGKNTSPLVRRSMSSHTSTSLSAITESNTHTPVDTVLVQIGTPDHEGWLRKKGGHFSTWKNRYLVLKGAHLYWLKTDCTMSKVEGHVNVASYRVVPDDTTGSYGFKLLRGSDRVHFFSSDDQTVIRGWMKVLLKRSIKRDHTDTKAMSPSTDLTLVPLEVARAMNLRPPSPTTAAATQREQRRENLRQLSTHGEVTLAKMQSMPSFRGQTDKTPGPSRTGSISSELVTNAVVPQSPIARSNAPVRPPRDARRKRPQHESQFAEQSLTKWTNGHLPPAGTPIVNHRTSPSNYNELDLLQIAESIKDIRGGSSCSPKGMFPQQQGPSPSPGYETTLEGLFALVNVLLGEEPSSSSSDSDVAKREKEFQLLGALRALEGHRAVFQPIGVDASRGGPSQAITRV